MRSKKIYYGASDIAGMLDISLTSAYKVIKELNEKLLEEGYYIKRGKISKVYFNEKWYGGTQNFAIE